MNLIKTHKTFLELLYANQQLRTEDLNASDHELCERFGYGFGWTRHGVLGRFSDEIADLLDLEDPENVLIEERTAKLKEFDEKHFQEQHYL